MKQIYCKRWMALETRACHPFLWDVDWWHFTLFHRRHEEDEWLIFLFLNLLLFPFYSHADLSTCVCFPKSDWGVVVYENFNDKFQNVFSLFWNACISVKFNLFHKFRFTKGNVLKFLTYYMQLKLHSGLYELFLFTSFDSNDFSG